MTAYGRLLLAKIGVFGVAAAIGGWNGFVLKLRMGEGSRVLAGIARNVWVEAVLGTAAVAIVAVMGTLPPNPG